MGGRRMSSWANYITSFIVDTLICQAGIVVIAFQVATNIK